jgi:hypothetical protein
MSATAREIRVRSMALPYVTTAIVASIEASASASMSSSSVMPFERARGVHDREAA